MQQNMKVNKCAINELLWFKRRTIIKYDIVVAKNRSFNSTRAAINVNSFKVNNMDIVDTRDVCEDYIAFVGWWFLSVDVPVCLFFFCFLFVGVLLVLSAGAAIAAVEKSDVRRCVWSWRVHANSACPAPWWRGGIYHIK